jgi:serine/threonine protein kinase
MAPCASGRAQPENILLASSSDNTSIKLADFGFAKHTADNDRVACGTVGAVLSC